MKNFELRKSLVELDEFEKLSRPHEYNLINRVNAYACMSLQELDIEGLRTLIAQGVGLRYCIPLALNELKDNFLAEGDFYKGDLFVSIASLEGDSWVGLSNEKEFFTNMIKKNAGVILEHKLDRKLNRQLKALVTH